MAGDPITLHQAAEHLGVHYMTAYRYVRTGRLPAVKDGAEWRVDPADLDSIQVGRRSAIASTPDAPLPRWSADPARLARRLIRGDEPGSWQLIEDALTAGASSERIYTHLLVPAMAEVGDRWSDGTVTIADEHTATVTVQRLVGRLGPSFNRPGRKRGTIVVGAAPGDQHGLAAGLLADPLRGRGFQVVDLGANVPEEAWVDAVLLAERLRAVAIAMTADDLDGAVASAVRAIHAAASVPVIVGGGSIIDAAHAAALGADGWAPTHAEALALFERLANA